MYVFIKNKISFLLIVIFVFALGFSSFADDSSAKECPNCHAMSFTSTYINRPTGDRVLRWTCSSCGYSSTDEGSSHDINAEMNDDELLQHNAMFYDMMKQIFNVDDIGNDTNSVFNPKATMTTITGILLTSIASWGNTTLYKVFIALAIFLLFVSFVMTFYSNSLNSESKTLQQYTRLVLQFTLAFFIIANVNKIAEIIISIFSWTMGLAWSYSESVGVTDGSSGIADTVKTITIELLRDAGADKSLNPLENFMTGFNRMLLVLKFLVPWLVSLVGNFGVLFAVVKSEFTIFVNVMLYPLAAHDCFDNIKQSQFIKYTKRIASSALELTIIVLVLIANQILLSNYVADSLSGVDKGTAFHLGLMSAIFSLVKMTVATSVASSIATSVFGG